MSSRSREKRHARRRRARLLQTCFSRQVNSNRAAVRPLKSVCSGDRETCSSVSSADERSSFPPVNMRQYRKGRSSCCWGRRILVCLSALLLVWVALILILPPTILRTVLEEQMSDALNAPVVLEQVQVNPFTLEIEVSGIRISQIRPVSSMAISPDESADSVAAKAADADSIDFLRIERLFIRPQLGTLFRPFPILASVEVLCPQLNISYLGDGHFSFSELLSDENEERDFSSFFSVCELKIADGILTLRDEPLGFVHTIHDIRLFVPFDRTEGRSEDRVPSLSAEVGGTQVVLNGIRQSESGRVQFSIQTTPLHMEYFQRYLAAFTPVRLSSGEIALDLLLDFSQPSPGNVEIALSGSILAEKMEVLNPDGEVIGRLKWGEAELERVTLNERLIRLRRMELDGLYLRLTRDQSGKIDWENWMGLDVAAHIENVTDSAASGSRQADEERIQEQNSGNSLQDEDDAAFVVEGADLILRNSDFSWKDETVFGSQWIEITGVDGRIAEYSTRPGARTAMRLSFGINSEGVLALEGEGTLNPPFMHAGLMIQDLPLLIARPLVQQTLLADMSGYLNLKGDLRLGMEASPLTASGHAGSVPLVMEKTEVGIRELTFARGKNGVPAVRVSSCSCEGMELDTMKRRLSLNGISFSEPCIRLSMDSGTIDLAGSLSSERHKMEFKKHRDHQDFSGGGIEVVLPPSISTFLTGWSLNLKQFSLKRGRVERVLTNGRSETLLSDLSLQTGQITQDTGKTVDFQLHAGTAGSLDIQGSLRPFPLQGTLQVRSSEFVLAPLNPFLRSFTNLDIQGRMESSLELHFSEQDRHVFWMLSGNMALRDLVLHDAVTGHLFGGIRRIAAESVRWQSKDMSLDVASFLIDKARLGLVLSESGRLDFLSTLMKSEADNSPTVQSAPSQKAEQKGAKIGIGKIRIQDGTIVLRDRRRKPELAMFLRNMDATVSGVHRYGDGSGAPAAVQLAGQLDGAPLSLVGRADCLALSPSASLTLQLKGANLAHYSSYFNEFLGYPVKQGVLDLETRLELSDGAFTLDNSIKVKKLVLGPKDTRPDAPDYPVTLGLALLEDMQGNLALELPIRGRLDDPSLQIDGLVGRALGGLFAKVITSPFALVGNFFSLFMPEDPDISLISFRPGQAQLSREARLRLDELSNLLVSRPKLKLELTGQYEPFGDDKGLRREQLLRRLGALSPAKKSSELRFSPAEYERRLRILYARLFVATGDEEPDAMEQKLLARETVDETALRALARRRAETVYHYLTSREPALASRVTLARGNDAVRSGSAHVELSLR